MLAWEPPATLTAISGLPGLVLRYHRDHWGLRWFTPVDRAAAGHQPNPEVGRAQRFVAAAYVYGLQLLERDAATTFVKQLGQMRRKLGRDLVADVVRAVLLDFGWQAHAAVASCIGRAMQYVARALPEPLTPAEQARFRRAFDPQPHFGGLSPRLLDDERSYCSNPSSGGTWMIPPTSRRCARCGRCSTSTSRPPRRSGTRTAPASPRSRDRPRPVLVCRSR